MSKAYKPTSLFILAICTLTLGACSADKASKPEPPKASETDNSNADNKPSNPEPTDGANNPSQGGSEQTSPDDTPAAVIKAPTRVVVKAISDSLISVSWEQVAGAKNYNVYLASNAAMHQASKTAGLSSNQLQIGKLIAASNYYVTVSAVDKNGQESAASAVQTVTTKQILAAPTALQAQQIGKRVRISWASQPAVSGYNLYYAQQSFANVPQADHAKLPGFNKIEGISANQQLLSSSQFASNSKYYFVLSATAGQQHSAFSDEVALTLTTSSNQQQNQNPPPPPPPPPVFAPPTGLKITEDVDSSFTLECNQVPTATLYEFHFATQSFAGIDPKNYSTLTDYAKNGSVYNGSYIGVNVLKPNTKYYFVVTANDGSKTTAASNEVSLTTRALPSAPTGLAVAELGNKVEVSWDKHATATKYQLHFAEESFAGANDYSTLNGYILHDYIASNIKNLDLSNFSSGKSYYFVVKASDDYRDSTASNEVVFTPKAANAAPTDLKVSAAGDKINLSWQHGRASQFNLHYAEATFAGKTALQYSSLLGYQKISVNNSKHLELELSKLTAGAKYYFVVTAIDGGTEGDASNEANIAPQAFIVNETGNNINAYWAKHATATDYKLYYKQSSFAGISPSQYGSQPGVQVEAINNAYNKQFAAIDFTTKPVSRNFAANSSYYFVLTAVENSSEFAIGTEQQLTISPSFLNDTNITNCATADATSNTANCSQAVDNAKASQIPQGQDGAIGSGKAGSKGMQFSKLQGFEDQCVVDEHTGLMWEVKQTDGRLHDKDKRYYWYNPDSANNGGAAGKQADNDCVNDSCDTAAFVAQVNAAGWCGYSDWRLPTVQELASIVDYSAPSGIDTSFFPNTYIDPQVHFGAYLSATTYVNIPSQARTINFGYVYLMGKAQKSNGGKVRLVRTR